MDPTDGHVRIQSIPETRDEAHDDTFRTKENRFISVSNVDGSWSRVDRGQGRDGDDAQHCGVRQSVNSVITKPWIEKEQDIAQLEAAQQSIHEKHVRQRDLAEGKNQQKCFLKILF